MWSLLALLVSVHDAMVARRGVPQRDRSQIITEHDAGALRFDRHSPEIECDDGFVLIGSRGRPGGRTPEAKRSFYASVAAGSRTASGYPRPS